MDLNSKEANEAGAKGGEGTADEVSVHGLLGQSQQGLLAIGRTLVIEPLGSFGQKSETVRLGFKKSGVLVLRMVWGRGQCGCGKTS